MVSVIHFRAQERHRRRLVELVRATGADSPSEVLRMLIEHAQLEPVEVTRPVATLRVRRSSSGAVDHQDERAGNVA